MTSQPPLFHLQPLLSDVYLSSDLLDLSGPSPSSSAGTSLFSSATSIAAAAGRRVASSSPSRPASAQHGDPDQRKEVRCVEGYSQNLYIGGSDGVIEWWVCDGAGSGGNENGWALRHRHTLFPRRPVSKMYILPKVSKLLVVSDGTLHSLTLPNLEPVPSSVMPPLRGVVSVVLDDDELEWDGEGSDDKNAEMKIVLVRRKVLGVYRLGNRLSSVKEIPLPSSTTHHAFFKNYVCASILSPESNMAVYSVIDLSDASMTEVLPVSQLPAEEGEWQANPNVVVVPGEDEFLVSSYTGSVTIGVFLSGQGDPVRGSMEWSSHPLALAVESGLIIALLRDQTITLHSLDNLEQPAQVISLATSSPAFNLSYSPYGITVRDLVRDEKMAVTRLPLLGGKLAPPSALQTLTVTPSITSTVAAPPDAPEGDEPPAGSGLTPPSSPLPHSATPQRASTSSAPFSTAIAETLAITLDGVLSLSPLPPIVRLEALCKEHHLEEACSLVDDERRRGRRGEIDGDKAAHQATVRYMHLYIAAHLMAEAMFERAGDYWIKGKADPRLVVRSFSVLRGKVIGKEEEVEVYAGLKDVLMSMPSVEDIIATSIKRNYSPHVQPNSATAPETNVLRSAMEDEANHMLIEVLRRIRSSRRKGGGARGVDSRKIDIVIDTTLAKLLALKGVTNELLALLAGSNDCALAELEPFLAQHKYVLSTVMRQQGRTDRVLELLKEISEGDEPDPFCDDPVDELAQQLETVKDPELFTKYILWLVGKSPTKGLNILFAQPLKTGIRVDDTELIRSLRSVDVDAADRYLDHVVVSKRSPRRELHEELLARLLDEAEELSGDDGVKYHLEDLDTEYKLEAEPRPFIIFLAHVAPDTPIKRVRLKLLLFLQGSPFYDLEKAAERLEKMPAFKPELAVVYGRLAKHRPALHLLAREIGDSLSAQTYCTTAGEIIPPRVARAVSARVPGLDGWATMGEVGRRKKEVGEGVMRGLVKELLGVYMRDGKETSKQAAALLNAQSLHLDMLEVLDQMPDEWPADVVSTFFQRSLRKGLHEQYSWRILKAISAGQNLEISEQHLSNIRRIPPVVQDKPPYKGPDEGSIAEKEWDSFDEKGALTTGSAAEEAGYGVGEKEGLGLELVGGKEARAFDAGSDDSEAVV
ncbi:hypothetical protein IAT38_005338 [Cryptococcus sp. DSM 104549]